MPPRAQPLTWASAKVSPMADVRNMNPSSPPRQDQVGDRSGGVSWRGGGADGTKDRRWGRLWARFRCQATFLFQAQN